MRKLEKLSSNFLKGFYDMINKISEEYNIGICLLRIIASFIVVTCHYGEIPEFLRDYRMLAVPCFMFIAFLLWGGNQMFSKCYLEEQYK